jgi:hypothetical protein
MPSLMLHVACNTCGAYGFTDQTGPGDLDHAVRCVSPHGNPPGSVEGCCSTRGHTHEEHVAHVRETGDASARSVTITIGQAGPVALSGMA